MKNRSVLRRLRQIYRRFFAIKNGRRLCLRSSLTLARALSSPGLRCRAAWVAVLGFHFLVWLVSQDLNAVCCSWYCVHLKCAICQRSLAEKCWLASLLPKSFISLTAVVRLCVFAWTAPPALGRFEFFRSQTLLLSAASGFSTPWPGFWNCLP